MFEQWTVVIIDYTVAVYLLVPCTMESHTLAYLPTPVHETSTLLPLGTERETLASW